MPTFAVAVSASVSLLWSAPSGCPTQEEVRHAFVQVAKRDAEMRDVQASAAIEQTGDGSTWRMRLETVVEGKRSHREIEAPSCAELAEAAAVLVALEAEREESPSPVETAAAPPAASSIPDERAASETTSAGSRFALAVGGALSAGAFGASSYGLTGSASWLFGKNRVAIDGAWFPPVAVDDDGHAIRGTFDLLIGGLGACRSILGSGTAASFDLAPCVGFELGRVGAHGAGRRVSESLDATTLWAAARAGVLLGYRVMHRVNVRADIGAVLPVVRDRFVVEGVATVHTPAVVTLRAAAGVEVHFP